MLCVLCALCVLCVCCVLCVVHCVLCVACCVLCVVCCVLCVVCCVLCVVCCVCCVLCGTLDECKSWCDSWTETSSPLKRISEAIAVLQEPSSRTRRANLQSMCKLWDVQQYHAQKKRQLPEIEADFERKILKETRRLGELHDF